jgi:hypothetical protein
MGKISQINRFSVFKLVTQRSQLIEGTNSKLEFCLMTITVPQITSSRISVGDRLHDLLQVTETIITSGMQCRWH